MNPAAAHNSRDGRKKSPDAACCVTTRRSPQSRPRQRTRFAVALTPPTPAVFAAAVPLQRAVGAPQLGIGTSVAVWPPANGALPSCIPDLDSTVGYTAAPGRSGCTPSANSFATPAAPHWPPLPDVRCACPMGGPTPLGQPGEESHPLRALLYGPIIPPAAATRPPFPALAAHSAEGHLPTVQPRPSAH